jgi:cation diffusion facilitator family transporter
MKTEAKRATIIGIIGNVVLFFLKITVGLIYNSIAVISDAVNSFTDIIASIIVFISVKVSGKAADKKHPFGHHRAEPIAGLIVAILTGILGFEIIKAALGRLMSGEVFMRGIVPIAVMGFTVVLKSIMYWYCIRVGRKLKSTAILASSLDHRNDVVISSAALIGVAGGYFGISFLDAGVALVIGVWIIYVGYKIGMDNLKFLIGESAPDELMTNIRKIACRVEGVKGVNDVRAHYVGVLLHVEVHIEVDRHITIYRAHSIGKKVQRALEKNWEIERAFVHIDPVR